MLRKGPSDDGLGTDDDELRKMERVEPNGKSTAVFPPVFYLVYDTKIISLSALYK